MRFVQFLDVLSRIESKATNYAYVNFSLAFVVTLEAALYIGLYSKIVFP